MSSEEFYKDICMYCDNNIGEQVLFTAFSHLWNSSEQIIPQKLADLTSRILNNLEDRSIIREIRKSEKRFYDFYPMYEILPHESTS